MGFEDILKEGENAIDGQAAAGQQTANVQPGKGGNMAMEDTIADSTIDSFAAKEGVPAAFDAEINNVVNDEINKII